jgi:alpha-L-rhamnosidase
MKKLYFLIFIGSLFACNQVKKKVPTGQGLFKDDPAQWISDGRPLPGSDSLFYMAHPAPLFRKEFNVKQTIDSATLYITAAGYYLASLNGNPIGNNVLDPAWTDYSKRIYYSTYNVKDLIQSGENCLGVSLGNGFYNPLPLRKWGRRNLRNDLQIGKPKFLAKLVIYYENGTVEDIFSNNSWKYAYGPIVKNSVYIGVTYDARKEIGGWNTSGFNDQKWEYAVHGDSQEGSFKKHFFLRFKSLSEWHLIAYILLKKGCILSTWGLILLVPTELSYPVLQAIRSLSGLVNGSMMMEHSIP